MENESIEVESRQELESLINIEDIISETKFGCCGGPDSVDAGIDYFRGKLWYKSYHFYDFDDYGITQYVVKDK